MSELTYKIGQASLINGDALVALKRVHDSQASLVLTSPPYGIGKSYEVRSGIETWIEQQTAIIRECARILTDGGSVCWQVGNHIQNGEVLPLDAFVIPIMRAEGLTIRNRIVWTFGHGLHCSTRFSGRHETIIWATKGATAVFNLDAVRVPQKYPAKRHYKGPKKGQLSGNPLGKNPGDVWDIPNVKHNHPEKTAHPCQFPEALVARLVLALTQEGDLVVDPYAGSGTVGAVTERFGRKALLIERDSTYAKIALDRLQKNTGSLEAA